MNYRLSEQRKLSPGIFNRFIRTSSPVRLLLALLAFSSISITSRATSGFTDGPILCLFRNLTGLPCPFCGSTRAVGSIVQGDFIEAFHLNPLGYVFLFLLAATLITPAAVQALGDFISKKWWALKSSNQVLIAILTISLLWLINLPRLISNF